MEPIRVISPDLVLVDWGPMTMTISAWVKGEPRPVLAAKAAARALDSLTQLARFQKYMSRPAWRLKHKPSLPEVVSRARKAVMAVDCGLTPMAAVAGAAAGHSAELAFNLGADRVIANNGGDIALCLGPGQSAVVGIRPPGQDEALMAKLSVGGGSGVGGVATSGWQGRSLSPGVADLVSVWAKEAALADAAATWLAGKVDVDSPVVKRRPAESLIPGSDLGERLVAAEVGRLNADERCRALEQGMAGAKRLYEAGLAQGCLMAVQGDWALLDPGGLLEMEPGSLPGRGLAG